MATYTMPLALFFFVSLFFFGFSFGFILVLFLLFYFISWAGQISRYLYIYVYVHLQFPIIFFFRIGISSRFLSFFDFGFLSRVYILLISSLITYNTNTVTHIHATTYTRTQSNVYMNVFLLFFHYFKRNARPPFFIPITSPLQLTSHSARFTIFSLIH